jgi:23S rRNA pseudouridine1911/1915/1917 synthase
MEITVVFESSEYLVIDKPAGIMVHGDGRHDRPTVVDWLLRRNPEIAGIGEDARILVNDIPIMIPRPGIVHRLDADTSGLMVIAKTPDSFRHLKQQFHDRLVTKTYTAVVHGIFKQVRGTINQPIGDAKGGVQIKACGARATGNMRPAETTYRIVTAGHDSFERPLSVIQCVPKTGRTHQIRVHMQYMQHAIVSDHLYCPRSLIEQDRAIMPRLALHATHIRFTDMAGNQVAYESVLSPDIAELVTSLVPLG